jgi:hypothetical protein
MLSEVMGEVGPDPRRIEVIPETPPVRRAPPRPAPRPVPVPDRDPEPAHAKLKEKNFYDA